MLCAASVIPALPLASQPFRQFAALRLRCISMFSFSYFSVRSCVYRNMPERHCFHSKMLTAKPHNYCDTVGLVSLGFRCREGWSDSATAVVYRAPSNKSRAIIDYDGGANACANE